MFSWKKRSFPFGSMKSELFRIIMKLCLYESYPILGFILKEIILIGIFPQYLKYRAFYNILL